MLTPQDNLYSTDNLWVKKEEDHLKVGITQYAVSDTGDILLVELPEKGRLITKGATLVVIETAKAVIDIKSPVAGGIVQVNTLLEKKPEWIKDDPYGDGWLVMIKADASENLDHLLTAEKYMAFLTKEES